MPDPTRGTLDAYGHVIAKIEAIEPDGLLETLLRLTHEYDPPPIYVHESGAARRSTTIRTRTATCRTTIASPSSGTRAGGASGARGRGGPPRFLRVVAPGQLRVGRGLQQAARDRAGGIPAACPTATAWGCRDIRSGHPEVQCLMLTSYADDEALFSAILAGAAGYVLKQVRGTDLVDAIRRVAQGQSILDPSATARVLERMRTPQGPAPADDLSSLTEQERRILDHRGGADQPPDR